jgi:hypothetical protein
MSLVDLYVLGEAGRLHFGGKAAGTTYVGSLPWPKILSEMPTSAKRIAQDTDEDMDNFMWEIYRNKKFPGGMVTGYRVAGSYARGSIYAIAHFMGKTYACTMIDSANGDRITDPFLVTGGRVTDKGVPPGTERLLRRIGFFTHDDDLHPAG